MDAKTAVVTVLRMVASTVWSLDVRKVATLVMMKETKMVAMLVKRMALWMEETMGVKMAERSA